MASRSRDQNARRICGVVLLTLSLWLAEARAAEWLGLAGAEIAEDAHYAYVGALLPASGRLGTGVVQRVWLDWLGYSYQAGNITVDVQAPGAEYALGYQSAGARGWWGIYGAVQYRDAQLSPVQPDSAVDDHAWRIGLHLEGERRLGNTWRTNGNASVYAPLRSYWMRGRLLREVGAGLYIGPELIVQGDPHYDAQQLGVVLDGLRPSKETALAAKAGAFWNDADQRGWYLGLELARIF